MLVSGILLLGLFTPYLHHTPAADASTSGIVIAEARFIGPGGNNDEFVEFFNASGVAVDIGGWKLQACAAGGGSSIFSRATIPAGTTLAPGQHFLFTHLGYSGSVAGDATYSIDFPLTGGAAITDGENAIIDGIGSTPCGEGTAVSFPVATADAALARANGGCQDTDDNADDFAAISPSDPQNSASAAATCGPVTAPSGSGAALPALVGPGEGTLLTVAVTPGTNPASSGIAVTGDLGAIGGAASQVFSDDGTGGDAVAGDNIFSFSATVGPGASAGATSLPIAIGDAQSRTGSASIALTVLPARTYIHEIQGAAHRSPLIGQSVGNVRGIVTATRANGFYLQERDVDADADPATSEGLFVFTGTAPTVAIGDATIVGGTVLEFRPGGGGGASNLTTTEIGNPGRSVTIVSSGNPLPTATVIGSGGRVPPTTVIEDDATGDAETSGTFDPATDGLDFYESLEGMRVQVNDAVAVGPTNNFGELPVLADNGGGAGTRTARGGIVIQPGDFNPERLILDDALIGAGNMPQVGVGTAFPGAIVGVLDYDFGNFKFLPTAPPPAANTAGTATRETTPLTVGPNQLTIATFNVENLHPGNPQAKFAALAGTIVNNLRSPDIIALEEVQDNNGATNDATVDATATYNQLIAAIGAAGGPTYQFRQIDPADDQDGGEPGGNIRVGFLFRTDRGVAFVDRPGGTATAAVGVAGGAGGPRLSFSPGRIAPTNAAFAASRKPLAGEFTFNGRTLFVIANHFNSKGGDQPLFGHLQPPARPSEAQRAQQAALVRGFVDEILALDPAANVVVLGDLNDFEFSDTLTILEGGGPTALHTLIESLPLAERYSYIFDGNSQALDHILVSANLFANASFAYDIIHLNAEFSPQDSDHDPQLARFTLSARTPPTAGSFGATVAEDTPRAITLQGTAAHGGSLTYTIVAPPAHGTLGPLVGDQVTYAPGTNYAGPDSFTYRVAEDGVDSAIATVTLAVTAENDPPVADDGTAATGEDTGIAITLVATDADGGPLAYSVVTPPAHGTLGAISGNQVVYTPAPDYSGPDSFTFKANDGTIDSNLATVAIAVGATNDPPLAGNGAAATPANTAVAITLTATDPESGTLAYAIVTPPAHGTLGAIVGSQVTYTPTPGYSGPDTFTFRANDGANDSNVATVSITVLPPPPPPTFALLVATSGPGNVSPGSGQYAAGGAVTLTATPNAGASFIGWTVDGAPAGLGNPLAITLNATHAATAVFAPTPAFTDIAASPYADAIGTLAAYGAILGYGDGRFGPEDTISRAQMAALIARAMGWGGEGHGNPFSDRGGLDAELWRSVGTLAFYGVANGYGGGRFGPNDDVLYLQAISFITRAMVAKGYWVKAQADDPAIYPSVPADSSHRLDLVTFVQHAGPLPGFASDAPYAAWQRPATRGWYAAALLQALASRFATTP